MKIRQKLILGFITVVLLPCLTIMVFSIANLEKITKDLYKVQESGIGKLKSATQMANELAGIGAIIKECLLEKIEIGSDEVARAKKELEKSLLNFQKALELGKKAIQKGGREEIWPLKILEEKYQLYKKNLMQTMAVFGKKSYVAIDRFYETQVEKEANALLLDIRKFQETAEEEILLGIKQVQEAGKALTDLIFIISVLVFLFAIVLGFIIARSISGPIAKLMAAALEIGKGNLDTTIKIKSRDEIGKLACSFNRMVEDLRSSQRELVAVITAEKLKMESMVESMSEGVIMIDDRGDVIVFNPQARRMLGFGFTEEISAKVLDEKMQAIGLYEALKGCKNKEKPLIKEIIIMIRDKGVVLRSDMALVKNEKGEIIGTVIILRDITKEKEVDKMKSEFISIVSHELRTPLSITKEGISLVLDGIMGSVNEKQEKLLITARSNIDRLTNIINGLLDISKIEAGKIEIKKRLVNFGALINELISSFSKRAKNKGLELKVNLPEKVIEVYVDPDKINQVFTNLVTNALKFTENGCVEISVKEKENEIECVVADTGIGISKEDIPKVFGKFQQFGRVPGAGEKGTGLGLSIAKAIVELHDGKIWVESHLGLGTRFTFSLPKHTTEEFFKEYVNNGIQKAIEDNVKMSLIVVSLAEFDKLEERLPESERKQLLRDMEEVVQDSLRSGSAGDVAVRNTGELIIILSGCDKESALRVEARLAQILQDTLAKKEITKGITLRFGCATYPDEARVDEDLLKKAKCS